MVANIVQVLNHLPYSRDNEEIMKLYTNCVTLRMVRVKVGMCGREAFHGVVVLIKIVMLKNATSSLLINCLP